MGTRNGKNRQDCNQRFSLPYRTRRAGYSAGWGLLGSGHFGSFSIPQSTETSANCLRRKSGAFCIIQSAVTPLIFKLPTAKLGNCRPCECGRFRTICPLKSTIYTALLPPRQVYRFGIAVVLQKATLLCYGFRIAFRLLQKIEPSFSSTLERGSIFLRYLR